MNAVFSKLWICFSLNSHSLPVNLVYYLQHLISGSEAAAELMKNAVCFQAMSGWMYLSAKFLPVITLPLYEQRPLQRSEEES